MAVAVAEEKLLATHADRALEMVERVGDDVPFDDVVDIYTRLLRLSADESRALKTRALAALGQRSDQDRWSDVDDEEPEAPDDDEEQSLFSQLRRRLRGRMDEGLRFRIELEAARAEEALLYRHVANALEFVGLLESEMAAPEAVDLYIDALDVRESMNEIVYYLTLSRLADRHFGDGGQGRARLADASTDAEQPPEASLRIVEQDGD